MKLEEIFVDTTDPTAYRHSLTKFLLDKPSTGDLKISEAKALIDLLLEKDKDTGDWFIQDPVSAEAFYVIRSELKDQGQLALFLENAEAALEQERDERDEQDDTPDYEDFDEDAIPF